MDQLTRVFADSNFFIALFNPTDSLNLKARSILKKRNGKLILVISDLVFLEIVTIISQRIGRKFAIKAGDDLIANPSVEIVHVCEDLREKTWEIFKEIENKNVSFVDCSNVAVMRTEHISQILTFDMADFKHLQKVYRFKFYRGQ